MLIEDGSWKPVGVGRWRCSSEDLELRGKVGCSIDVFHIVNDSLWKIAPNASMDSIAEGDGGVLPEMAKLALQEYQDKQEKLEQERLAAQKGACLIYIYIYI